MNRHETDRSLRKVSIWCCPVCERWTGMSRWVCESCVDKLVEERRPRAPTINILLAGAIAGGFCASIWWGIIFYLTGGY